MAVSLAQQELANRVPRSQQSKAALESGGLLPSSTLNLERAGGYWWAECPLSALAHQKGSHSGTLQPWQFAEHS